MNTLQGSVSAPITASPEAAFDLITSIDRLPEWNAIIHHVVECPDDMTPGAEWVVELRSMGLRWNSRSWLDEVDPEARRFTFRTRSDDGNPSESVWTWQVEPAESGAVVHVSWRLYPKTFMRKYFIAHVRNRQLRDEVPSSIAELDAALTRRHA